MLKFVLSALLAISVLSVPSSSKQWPDYYERCGLNSPEFNQCIKRNLQLTYDKHTDGIPELEVASMDPYYMPEMLFSYSRDNIGGKMAVRNTKTYGLKEMQILDVRSNIDNSANMTFEVDFHLPYSLTEGEYKVDGRVSSLPIRGKGIFNISMTDLKGTFNVHTEIVQVNDVDYLRVKHMYVYPEIGDLKVHASNLFTGIPDLDKAVLRFGNNYWKLIYQEVLPHMAESFDKYGSERLNKMLLDIPFNSIFPESK